MSIVAILFLLLLGGAVALRAERLGRGWPQRAALGAVGAAFLPALALFAGSGSPWFAELHRPLVPRFGVALHLAADGLSGLLILLTLALGAAAVASAWNRVAERPGLFFLALLWVLAGLVGVFTALDLLLFFAFWEVMLIPMYLLIALWGHEGRYAAAMKFLLYTQAGGLLMLVAIVALALLAAGEGESISFDYLDLLGRPLGAAEGWLMAGFLVAFFVKLPVVPLHTWLPDAHTQAPTAASVLLAGLLLKAGAYGLIRFALPLFPHAAAAIAPLAMGLGVIGIFYGALLAYGQEDLKRLVAYTSVSHMGFVLLGLFAWNAVALQGVMMQMVAHALSTAGLFILAGALQERLGTRRFPVRGGLRAQMPRLAAFGLLFAAASLGLPGLGNFVGEFLILLGAFREEAPFAATAVFGLVAAAAYALLLLQRLFHGPGTPGALRDLSPRESAVAATLAVALLLLGVFPQPLFDLAAPGVGGLLRVAP